MAYISAAGAVITDAVIRWAGLAPRAAYAANKVPEIKKYIY